MTLFGKFTYFIVLLTAALIFSTTAQANFKNMPLEKMHVQLLNDNTGICDDQSYTNNLLAIAQEGSRDARFDELVFAGQVHCTDSFQVIKLQLLTRHIPNREYAKVIPHDNRYTFGSPGRAEGDDLSRLAACVTQFAIDQAQNVNRQQRIGGCNAASDDASWAFDMMKHALKESEGLSVSQKFPIIASGKYNHSEAKELVDLSMKHLKNASGGMTWSQFASL